MDHASRPFDLLGKVAVVTGAARGIGRAAVTALAAAGADIAGIDIAGPVSPILDYAPASAADLAETGRAVELSVADGWRAGSISGISVACVRQPPISNGNSVGSTFSSPMPASRRSSRSSLWRMPIGTTRSTSISPELPTPFALSVLPWCGGEADASFSPRLRRGSTARKAVLPIPPRNGG